MQREKIKTIICWFLVILCMGVIFWLSSRTSHESAEQSSSVLHWLVSIFGDNFFTDFIVRKLAHCLEFTGLCFLFNTALYQQNKKAMPVYAIIFTSLYAVTDEFHQLFVEGRACRVLDWAIDSFGALLGAISFIVIYKIIRVCSLKKQKFIDTRNN